MCISHGMYIFERMSALNEAFLFCDERICKKTNLTIWGRGFPAVLCFVVMASR